MCVHIIVCFLILSNKTYKYTTKEHIHFNKIICYTMNLETNDVIYVVCKHFLVTIVISSI